MQLLTSGDALQAALEASEQHPVLLFKHSTRCPISAAAYAQVNAFEEQQPEPVYLVKVIEDRPVSNEIAELLSIRHESPQALVVHHHKVVWNASHYDITSQALKDAFRTDAGE